MKFREIFYATAAFAVFLQIAIAYGMRNMCRDGEVAVAVLDRGVYCAVARKWSGADVK